MKQLRDKILKGEFYYQARVPAGDAELKADSIFPAARSHVHTLQHTHRHRHRRRPVAGCSDGGATRLNICIRVRISINVYESRARARGNLLKQKLFLFARRSFLSFLHTPLCTFSLCRLHARLDKFNYY